MSLENALGAEHSPNGTEHELQVVRWMADSDSDSDSELIIELLTYSIL